MLSVKLLGAEHVSQSAYVSMLNLLPGLDDLGASLIYVAKVENTLEIIDAVSFDMIGLVADRL